MKKILSLLLATTLSCSVFADVVMLDPHEEDILRLRRISGRSAVHDLTDQEREENLARLRAIQSDVTSTDPDAYRQYRLERLEEMTLPRKDTTEDIFNMADVNDVKYGRLSPAVDDEQKVKEVPALSTPSIERNKPSSFTQTISSGSTVAEPTETTPSISETVSTKKTVEPKTTKKEKMKDRVRKIRMKK